MDTRSTIFDVLRLVLSIPTAPFHEHRVAAFVRSFVESLGLEVVEDRWGNLIARYRHGRDSPPIAFVAHMDHPGFEVVTSNGTSAVLHALGDGGRQVIGAKIVAQTRDGEVRGIIDSAVSLDYPHGWRVNASFEGRVQRRDFAHWDLPGYRCRGKKIQSRAIDDLAGVSALLNALSELVRLRAHAEVHALFTRAEEVGFVGALAMADSGVLPDVPIVSIEMSKALPGAVQGRGYVVRLGDAWSLFDADLTQYLLYVAQCLQSGTPAVPFQCRIMDGGICEGTAFRALGRVASGVCLPLGNYHNRGPVGIALENIHADDFDGLVKFIVSASTQTKELCDRPRLLRKSMKLLLRKRGKDLLRKL